MAIPAFFSPPPPRKGDLLKFNMQKPVASQLQWHLALKPNPSLPGSITDPIGSGSFPRQGEEDGKGPGSPCCPLLSPDSTDLIHLTILRPIWCFSHPGQEVLSASASICQEHISWPPATSLEQGHGQVWPGRRMGTSPRPGPHPTTAPSTPSRTLVGACTYRHPGNPRQRAASLSSGLVFI